MFTDGRTADEHQVMTKPKMSTHKNSRF